MAGRRTWSVQAVLLTAGAVLMPLGLVAIWIGWYGAAHAKYGYDQFPYLISGGLLGLGLVVVGGFLYFGSWLAQIAKDQATVSREIVTALAELRERSADGDPVSARPDATALVVAGRGKTLHRSDCSLVSSRSDLREVKGKVTGLVPCRVCGPAQLGASA